MSDLLILYGEYRNFDVVIPQLKNLDKFDIIVSTWNHTKEFSRIPPKSDFLEKNISESDILNYIPNARCIISDIHKKFHYNTTNMISCWQRGLNLIQNQYYDRIFLHRTDMISTFYKIIDYEFDDVIYGEPGNIIDGDMDYFGDYLFAGKFDIMKQFITSFDLIEYPIPHKPIANMVMKMKFPYKEIKNFKCGLEYELVRYDHRGIIDNLNKNGIYFFDLPKKHNIRIDYTNISENFFTKNLEI